jgi:hypothetical protein
VNYFEAALTGNDHLIESDGDDPGVLGDAEEFIQVLEELDDMGRSIGLAELTGRWMRFGHHAARLRAVCIDAGLGEALTSRLVQAYIDAALPAAQRSGRVRAS